MKKWFWNQSEAPLGDILALRVYARAVASNTSNRGHEITQYPNHDIGIRGIRLGQTDLQVLFRRFIINLTNQLAQDLCFGFDTFQYLSRQIDIQRYSKTEDFTEISKGFSFLTQIDPTHRFDGFLIKHMLEHHQSEWLLAQPRYDISDISDISF